MKNRIIILTMLGFTILLGFNYENKAQPTTEKEENTNPRLSEPNPSVWRDLPMEIVISDFQESDGIFSSFICDEIKKRLQAEPLKSLQALKVIDKKPRLYAFKICLSSEVSDTTNVLNAIIIYSNKYPELVEEIKSAAE